MNLTLTLPEYFAALRGQENQPASLRVLLAPFDVSDAPEDHDEFLMIGHVLDAMADEFQTLDQINVGHVVDLAAELGVIL